jgi:predicted acylesterase/phospholipase RssA
MRGLVTVTTLLFMSRRLLGDETLPELANWIVGCSTGSMLGLALAKGNSNIFYRVISLFRQHFNRLFLLILGNEI